MSQGKPHPNSLKAKATGMLMAGLSIADVAKELDVPYMTVRTWKTLIDPSYFAEMKRKKAELFDDLMVETVEEMVKAQRFIAHSVQSDEYIRSHAPSEVATLFETLNDRSMRLLYAMQAAHSEGPQPTPQEDHAPLPESHQLSEAITVEPLDDLESEADG